MKLEEAGKGKEGWGREALPQTKHYHYITLGAR